ncbi:disks large homolog 1-like [Amyelois transitella]|uniref:disks large homolog 1-like n=1 Tax=Amyelois transitella TaxID=680683 RepID=UPI00298FE457|nr:disks large homolog 1-like [Amyelois transitella]
MEGKQIDPTPLASGSKVGTPPIERPSRESKPSPDVESPKKEEKEGISEVIVPNQETTIEIVQPPGVNTGRLILGIEYAGGSDTAFQGPGVVVYKIEKSGLAASDGRIRLGDQIRKVNDTVITEDLPLNRRRYIIETLAPPKARFTIFRPDPIPFDFYEVRLTKETKSERFKMTYECHGVHERNRGVYVKKTYQDDGGFELIHPGDIFVTINNKIVISVPDIAKILSSHISVLIKFKRFKLTRPEV